MTNSIRKGECNSCGWCCQFDGIHRNVVEPPPGQDFHPSDIEFYSLRGGQLTNDKRKILYVIQAYSPCAAHNKEEKSCSIYENRPLSCQEFPAVPEQIEGTPCSYWFELEEDGKLIQRGGVGSPYPTPPIFKG